MKQNIGVNDVNINDKTNAGKDSDKNKENTEDNLLDENGEKLGNVNTTKVVSAIGGSVAVTGILSVGGKVAYDQFTKNRQNKESRKGPQDQKEGENNTNNASPDSIGGSTTGQKDRGSFFNPWYVIAPGIGMILTVIIIVIFIKIKQNRKVETGYKFEDPDEDLLKKGIKKAELVFSLSLCVFLQLYLMLSEILYIKFGLIDLLAFFLSIPTLNFFF